MQSITTPKIISPLIDSLKVASSSKKIACRPSCYWLYFRIIMPSSPADTSCSNGLPAGIWETTMVMPARTRRITCTYTLKTQYGGGPSQFWKASETLEFVVQTNPRDFYASWVPSYDFHPANHSGPDFRTAAANFVSLNGPTGELSVDFKHSWWLMNYVGWCIAGGINEARMSPTPKFRGEFDKLSKIQPKPSAWDGVANREGFP